MMLYYISTMKTMLKSVYLWRRLPSCQYKRALSPLWQAGSTPNQARILNEESEAEDQDHTDNKVKLYKTIGLQKLDAEQILILKNRKQMPATETWNRVWIFFFFELFFTQEAWQLLVFDTNFYGTQKGPAEGSLWYPVTKSEISPD